MIELDKDNFDEKVLSHKGLFLVDFWSAACETCLDLMPQVEALEQELKGKAVFGKVNIQGNRRLAIREKVLGLPAIVIYKDGEKAASFSKEFTPEEVKAKVRELTGG
ncbi:MAG: thioredoxin family protein [Spirochaetota bacterium]